MPFAGSSSIPWLLIVGVQQSLIEIASRVMFYHISLGRPLLLNSRHVFNHLLNISTWMPKDISNITVWNQNICLPFDQTCSLKLPQFSSKHCILLVHGAQNWCLSFTAHTQNIRKYCWHCFQNISKILPFHTTLLLPPWTKPAWSLVWIIAVAFPKSLPCFEAIFINRGQSDLLKNLSGLCSGPCSVFSSYSSLKPSPYGGR